MSRYDPLFPSTTPLFFSSERLSEGGGEHGTPSRLSVGAGSCGWNTPTPTWTEGTPSYTESSYSGGDLGAIERTGQSREQEEEEGEGEERGLLGGGPVTVVYVDGKPPEQAPRAPSPTPPPRVDADAVKEEQEEQ